MVITTLPVLSLDGSFAYINEEKRNVFAGDLALFSGSDPATKAFSIKESELEWHVRGGSSLNDSKKPYKISLKNKS